MSEGAGIVILEELGAALKRGARIYAEVLGYGLNSDAYHVTAPRPDGEGAARVIRMALEDGRVSPENVQYINAMGPQLSTTIRLKRWPSRRFWGKGRKDWRELY